VAVPDRGDADDARAAAVRVERGEVQAGNCQRGGMIVRRTRRSRAWNGRARMPGTRGATWS